MGELKTDSEGPDGQRKSGIGTSGNQKGKKKSSYINIRFRMNRKQSKISLNCSLSAPPTTLPGSKTPNTPEILNTIVSITSQMGSHEMPDTMSPSSVPFQFATPSVADAPSARLSSTTPTNIVQRDSNVSPTLVQDFKSQFIKEGLKMKLEDGDSLQEILARNIKKEQEVKSFKKTATYP